jgi:hypothetical protein
VTYYTCYTQYSILITALERIPEAFLTLPVQLFTMIGGPWAATTTQARLLLAIDTGRHLCVLRDLVDPMETDWVPRDTRVAPTQAMFEFAVLKDEDKS